MTETQLYHPYTRKNRADGGIMDNFYKNKKKEDGTYPQTVKDAAKDSWKDFLNYIEKTLDYKDPRTYATAAGIFYMMYKARSIKDFFKMAFKKYVGMDYTEFKGKVTTFKNKLIHYCLFLFSFD